MTSAEKLTILKRHVRELAEIYDNVQVLASWLTEQDTTSSHKQGTGNWYARQGLAQEFIREDAARDTAEAIVDKLEPPDDEWKKPA